MRALARVDVELTCFAPVDVATIRGGVPFLPEHTWDESTQRFVGTTTRLLVGCPNDETDADTIEECIVRHGDRVLVDEAEDPRRNGIFFRDSQDDEPWRLRRAADANSARHLVCGRTVVVRRGFNQSGGALTATTPEGAVAKSARPGVDFIEFD